MKFHIHNLYILQITLEKTVSSFLFQKSPRISCNFLLTTENRNRLYFSSRNLTTINNQPIILLNPAHAVPNQVKHQCNPSHTEHTSHINPHITTIPSSIVRNQHGITKPHAQSKIPATTTSNPTCMSTIFHFP